MNAVQLCMSNNHELDKRLFSTNDTIHQDIIEHLLTIYDFLQGFLEENIPNISISDAIIQGSSVCYTYNRNSDIDFQLVCHHKSYTDDALHKILSNICNNLLRQGYEFNVLGRKVDFLFNGGASHTGATSSGVYSVLHNSWVSIPQRKEYIFNYSDAYNSAVDLLQLSEKFINSQPTGNSQLGLESCDKIDKYLKSIADYAIDSAKNDEAKEYNKDYTTYRILRKSGVYLDMKRYLTSQRNAILSM